MSPREACLAAIAQLRAAGDPANQPVIHGLEHAVECLYDTGRLLRHIRQRLPTYEPELFRLITTQLLKGCDL